MQRSVVWSLRIHTSTPRDTTIIIAMDDTTMEADTKEVPTTMVHRSIEAAPTILPERDTTTIVMGTSVTIASICASILCEGLMDLWYNNIS